ncbi:rCG63699 [Rattus norvegicus]|nr:rCG63699 [Rattus norvegicus]
MHLTLRRTEGPKECGGLWGVEWELVEPTSSRGQDKWRDGVAITQSKTLMYNSEKNGEEPEERRSSDRPKLGFSSREGRHYY